MALVTLAGMIFALIVDGISHLPKGFTSAEDMVIGASMLFRTVLEIGSGALE